MTSAADNPRSLQDLARHWGLSFRGGERVRKVWRLRTDRGTYCLKRSVLGPEELLFIEAVQRHLARRGFRGVLPPLPTLGGMPYAAGVEGIFVLYPWQDSQEADFDQPRDLALAVETLAELHERSGGFVPYRGDAHRVRWGLWPEILAARRNQLAEFGARAAAGSRESLFCARYARLFPYYYAQAGRALAALAASPYGALCAEAVAERSICHHDYSARNILLNAERRPTVVDFDYCLADLRLHDLANLILRRLRHGRWRPERAAEVLDLYHRCRPLDEREYAVLHPFLLWPQDFWQVGLQYFLEELPWSKERYLETLRKKTEDRADRAAFLSWYAAEYEQKC